MIRAQHNYSDAFDERVNLMRVAQNMYEEYPVAGVGFGTYADVKKRYLPGDWEGWLSLVHNRYLLIRAETGTLGILSLVFLYGMMMRAAWRGILKIDPSYRPFQIALAAALIAIFWEMAWDIFHSRQQSYILWYVVALAVIAPRVLKENQSECPT
jgi:O-antigen ligase